MPDELYRPNLSHPIYQTYGCEALTHRALAGVVDKSRATNMPDLTKQKRILIKRPSQAKEIVQNPHKRVATFRAFHLSGNTVYRTDELSPTLQKYLNRPLNNADLSNIKLDIVKFYAADGYNLVKVITPPQNITSGVLHIQIVEADVEAVLINDPKHLLCPYLKDAIRQRIQIGDVFNDMETESLASDFSDINNVTATAVLQPGLEFKNTAININLDEAKEDVQSLKIDNYGSDLTGRGQATLHLEKSNLAHIGETVYTNLKTSTGKMWSAEVGAKIPVFYRNLNLETSYQHSKNQIEGRLKPLNSKGESDQFNIALASDVINRINRQVTLRGGLELRNHMSDILGAKDSADRVRQAFIEATWLERMDDLTTYLSARLIKGIDILGETHKNDFFISRAGAEPDAVIFRPSFAATYKTDILPYSSTLKFNANAQITDKVLLASDMFIAGGYGSVRGFELAQESGDEGYGFSAEYAVDLPLAADWQFSAGPFYDFAQVSNHLTGVALDNTLQSAGLGFDASTESLIPTGKTNLRLDWAHTLGAYADKTIDADRVYFQLGQEF
jgi:hemolysin activation/secretion protein